MHNTIEMALNELYRRQISTREQLLNEMMRVKMTFKIIEKQSLQAYSKDTLFENMKKATEDELGLFPAESSDFYEIYTALKDIDLVEFALEIYKNDRMGIVISPLYLTNYIRENIEPHEPQRILITEAEKHLNGLEDFIKTFKNTHITLTTQYVYMHKFLKLAFGDLPHVQVVFESIYTNCLIDQTYDYIYTIPTFGYKPEELGVAFMSRESDGIALENMLAHLNKHGVIDIIVPAKMTFATQGYEQLRAYITKHYNVEKIFILPEGTFKPTTAIKTYLLRITTSAVENIQVGSLTLSHDTFEPTDCRTLSKREFLEHNDWRIELLLSEANENIQKFKGSHLEKVKLKEIAEVFRGKSILKKDTVVGAIGVLNISNIENGEIDYSNMDTIEEEEKKIKRYALESGDVVLSCRGTAIKTAVFQKQNRTIIASANLIVVRPSEKILGDYIKIFFESPIGLAIIKSFQRGTTIMNINHSDIMEMEISIVPLEKQRELVNFYETQLDNYNLIIKEAEAKWQRTKSEIYEQLI